MNKIAINRFKEELLSKSVGLITHPGSQWKYALRQLKGRSGKQLSEAKNKLGLLTNNQRLSLVSATKKGKIGQEFGISNKGKLVKGDIGHISGDVNNLIAHTHPNTGGKYLSIMKENEFKRLLNSITAASPSGINYKMKPMKNYPIPTYKDIPTNLPLIILENTSSRLYKKYLLLHDKLLKTDYYKRYVNNEYRTDMLDAKMKSFFSGKPEAYQMNKPHSILSNTITGVHKTRYNIPTGIRSIYFKGGYEQ